MKYLALTFLLAINGLAYLAQKKDPSHKPLVGSSAYHQYKQTKRMK